MLVTFPIVFPVSHNIKTLIILMIHNLSSPSSVGGGSHRSWQCPLPGLGCGVVGQQLQQQWRTVPPIPSSHSLQPIQRWWGGLRVRNGWCMGDVWQVLGGYMVHLWFFLIPILYFFNLPKSTVESKSIMYKYISPYLVLLLILELFLAKLAMLPYGLDSNVTKLLANLLTKPSEFYYFANCIV